jgi:PAS domain S-box-containing protein
MRYKNWKSIMGSKSQLIVIAAFLLLSAFSLFNELLDLPNLIFGVLSTPVNWTEIAIEIMVLFFVLLILFNILFIIESKRKQLEKELQESEEKYRALFETATDAIFLSDETGKFIDVNKAAIKLLGYSKEELLKLRNKDIDVETVGYEEFMRVASGIKKEAIFEVTQKRKDGTQFPVEITGNVFSSGDKKISLAIARDITERKQAEKKLISRNKEMETFQEIVVGRELKMIELKKEINELLEKSGKKLKYKIIV